jgi:hypothetical protein
LGAFLVWRPCFEGPPLAATVVGDTLIGFSPPSGKLVFTLNLPPDPPILHFTLKTSPNLILFTTSLILLLFDQPSCQGPAVNQMEKILIRGRCRTQISHRRACDYFIYGICLYTKCPYILVLIYKVMLQHLVRRCLAPCLHRTARTALMTLRLGAPITSARAILNEKKKQAYQNQM